MVGLVPPGGARGAGPPRRRPGRRGSDRLGPIPPLRLGKVYEELGDGAQAPEHYQGLLTLWKGADPELEPFLEQARAGLARRQYCTRRSTAPLAPSGDGRRLDADISSGEALADVDATPSSARG